MSKPQGEIRDTFTAGYLRDVSVADLSEAECVVELRRIRAIRGGADEECEFADIADSAARRALCAAECHCGDNADREKQLVLRLMRGNRKGPNR